jgi:hypothetical protein
VKPRSQIVEERGLGDREFARAMATIPSALQPMKSALMAIIDKVVSGFVGAMFTTTSRTSDILTNPM